MERDKVKKPNIKSKTSKKVKWEEKRDCEDKRKRTTVASDENETKQHLTLRNDVNCI
jgi:hypothetical protein